MTPALETRYPDHVSTIQKTKRSSWGVVVAQMSSPSVDFERRCPGQSRPAPSAANALP